MPIATITLARVYECHLRKLLCHGPEIDSTSRVLTSKFSLLTRALLCDGEEEELEPLGEGEDERVPVHHQREPRTRLVQRRRWRTLWIIEMLLYHG